MVFEDEEPWPANPWQAQADAQLQRWVETVTVQRLHQLEGQLEAAEALLAARSYELEQASKELELLRHRKAPVDAELVDLREKNDFLQVLIKRFERKVMVLEEENVKLKAPVVQKDVATQAEEPLVHELEGQLALLEGDLRSKEHELRTAQAALSEERGSLGRFRAAAKGRTPLELMKELEALQSRNGFLQDLVSRFEDKTMMMEKQLKSLGSAKQELDEELARCRREHLEAKAAASEELRTSQMRSQQLKEEAKGAALTLRDAKREHNKRVQELLKQLCEAKGKAKKINEDLCDRKELRELKELNGQLVERLGKERADKAEAMGGLERCRREQDSLELRCQGLREQLIQLAELNEELELRCT